MRAFEQATIGAGKRYERELKVDYKNDSQHFCAIAASIFKNMPMKPKVISLPRHAHFTVLQCNAANASSLSFMPRRAISLASRLTATRFTAAHRVVATPLIFEIALIISAMIAMLSLT